MEILISVAAKIAEYAVGPIGRQLGYLCFYKRHVDELKTQITDFRSAEEKLQRLIDDAKRNGEDIEADVEKLLTDVNKITQDNENFKRDEEQANTKCCTGAFPIPNLVLRHRLSRRAKKMTGVVVTTTKRVNDKIPTTFSYSPFLRWSIENENYVEFKTRNVTLACTMEALKDPTVGILGVWGMGGVGKTVLAKEVARKSKDEEKLFSEVVFITISQTPNIQKIQEDIRKCLGMDQHEMIGERIKNRLRKENNILVIVDDVWEKIELADVGISFGKDKKGCKILVTSRHLNVLRDMDVNKFFQVGVLSESEANNLFSKIVGDEAKKHDRQAGLETRIVKECGGFPIAITTVTSALKNNDSPHQVWKNALHELQKSDPINIEGMDKNVYSSIKLSYSFLQSEEAKKLLLLCSLFEEDAKIPVELLCNYGIGLNMFQGTNKLEDATNKTVKLVRTLKDRSLLLLGNDIEDGDFVKLHDVIRDVIISIASSKDDGPMFNIRNAVDEMEEYLVKEKFRKSNAVSLQFHYDIEADQYSEPLKLPNL